MKKLLILAALAATAAGCLVIKVEDYGQEVVRDSAGNPILDTNGVVQVIHKGQTWYFNKNMVEQAMEKIAFARKPGDDVSFEVTNYRDVVSDELAKVIDASFQGAAELAAKVGAAIATSGGSVAGDAAKSAIKKAISNFVSKGGDAAKATVDCSNGACTISDGSVTETCTDCGLPGWVEPDPVP